MTDQLSGIGQNFPSANLGQNQSSAFGNTSYKGSDLSFENVLNRQQLTASQLNSLRPPAAFRSSNQSTKANPRSNSAPESTLFKSYADKAESGKKYEEELPDELLKMFQHMPQDLPQGKQLHQTILQNQQDYQKFKSNLGETESAISSTQSHSINPQDFSSGQHASLDQNRSTEAISMNHQSNPDTSFGAFAAQHSNSQVSNTPRATSNEATSQPASSFNSLFAQAQNLFPDSEANNQYRFSSPPDYQLSQTSGPQEFRSSMVPPSYGYNSNQSSSSNMVTQVPPSKFTSQNPTPEWEGNTIQKTMSYEDNPNYKPQNHSQMIHEEGPTETALSFFQDLFSGVTFGIYTPSDEQPPDSFTDHIIHPFKKIFYEAPKDIVYDLPASMIRSAGNPNKTDTMESSNQQKDHLAGPSSKPWMTNRFRRT